jgi:hypothetical protein
VVAAADGADEAVGGDAAEDGDGELGADAGDGEELFEEALLGGLGEPEEEEGVFANVGVDVEAGFGAEVAELGIGGDGDGELVANAVAVEDNGVGCLAQDLSTKIRDHRSIVAIERRRGSGRARGGSFRSLARLQTLAGPVVIAVVIMPIMVVAVKIAAVVIGHLVAALEAAAEVVARGWRDVGTAEVPMTMRIGGHAVIQIIMRGLDAGVKSLALEVVEFLGRLLPTQVEADLRVGCRDAHRGEGHAYGQRGCGQQRQCRFGSFHQDSFRTCAACSPIG